MFSKSFDRSAFSKRLQSQLRVLRAAAGLSQSDVAQALGLVRSTYVNYENGTKEIPWEKCLALVFYFESIPASLVMMETLKLLPKQSRRDDNDEQFA